MATLNNVLLLVGSPRSSTSTSYSLGSYLCSRLQDKGSRINTIYTHLALRREAGLVDIAAATDAADLIVLAFPLYIDCLPAAVIRVLEAIATHRKNTKPAGNQRFLAISNCGFPEAYHIDVALAICKRFAHETGLQWVGGLALGGGEAIHGRPLQEVGRMSREVMRALDLSADALSKGDDIPLEARLLMAKPFVSPWLYRLIGSYGWKKEARKYGTSHTLNARPYEKTR